MTDIDVSNYQIDNVAVYGLEETTIASGFPMQTSYNAEHFKLMANDVEGSKHIQRMNKLAAAPIGSGHDNALKGIDVHFNVTASMIWWLQEGRYKFIQIISSYSKMHKLRDMAERGTIKFIGVDPRMEKLFLTFVEEGMDNVRLSYNCPPGMCLTARLSTNYCSLKNIYNQRKNHKLPEWRKFCDWLETLPHSNWIIQK
jgi:hypothetical protein